MTYVTAIDEVLVVEALKISPKYQIVIPKSAREVLALTPGQKLQVVLYGDRIELIPVKPLRQMKGFLRGLDTDVPREGDRV